MLRVVGRVLRPAGAPMKQAAWTAAFLLAATPAALSQTPSGSASSDAAQARPVYRSGLDLVRLDVRVTDDDGRPITDLRPDELRIEEEGTALPILLFQHIEAPRGTYAEAAQRTISAEVSTNQGSPQGHVYVLVFDEVHILPGHEQRVRLAAERFLRTHVRPGDRVALYALPGPGPQIPFTGDVARVLRELPAVRATLEETGQGALSALAPMRTYEAYQIVRGDQKTLDRLANEVSQNLLGSDTRPTVRGGGAAGLFNDPAENRTVLTEDARSLVARADGDARRFLTAFADLIRTLRAVDGRKAVLLFSEGFHTDNVTRELEEVAAAAAQSYSVIYALDLNPRTVEANEQSPRGGEQFSEVQDKMQSLGSLTAETAGTLVVDAPSQIDNALARLADTSEDYYLVGFTPANPSDTDRNRYRHIRVTVRRPGAHVSARTGYALEPRNTPADRRRTIDAALQAPFAQKGLEVEYTTYTLRGSSSGMQRVIVSLGANLPVASATARSADVVYVVRDATTGKVAASGSDELALPDAPGGSGATTGTGVYRVQFELPAGTYLMRALVREPGGLLGSADRRFQVRALNGPDISASDLVIGSSDVKGLPVRATVYASDVLTGVFELYGRSDAELDGLKVTSDLVPVEGGSAVISGPAELQPITAQTSGFSRGARLALPLSGVAPGEYLARATIRNGNETVTEVLRDVTVKAGPRPALPEESVAARFDPRDLLDGEITRRLFETIQVRAKSSTLEAAAHAALAGKWTLVESSLASVTPQVPDTSILRGAAAYARADYPAAVASFRAAQDAGAHEPSLAFILGWAHAASGDDRAAIAAWRSAIVADPGLVPSYLALVDAYLRLGQRDLALQVVKSGLTALPSSTELRDRLATLEGRR
jgi:VWFA-related protein